MDRATAHLQTLYTVHAPDPAYDAENFRYIPEGDYYLCPQSQRLTTTGKRHKAAAYYFKRYATMACKSCHVKVLCSKATYGKAIQRSEYHEYIQHNKERLDLNKALYKWLYLSQISVTNGGFKTDCRSV